MGFLIFLAVIALIPAGIAHNKGRTFFLWWIYGMALWIIALIHSLIINKNEAALEERLLKDGNHKRCPHCTEVIKLNARFCRHCSQSVA